MRQVHAQVLQSETESTRSGEAFWRHAPAVSPRIQEDGGRRVTDASRLTFPIQLVIYIVSATIAGTLAVWTANSGQNQKIDSLDSKFSLVLEKLASQQQIKEQESKLSEERLSNMRESIRKMEARIEMMQIQQAGRDKEINDSLVQLKTRR